MSALSIPEPEYLFKTAGLPGAMPRPITVAMVGAGSFFTNSVLKDVLLIPENRGGELRLIDIDTTRLELSGRLMQKIVDESGQGDRWKVSWSTDRLRMLEGCDYVVNSIEVSGIDCVRHDNDIPLQYGVSQCIGDTIGPGGLFKGLRTIPVWIDILKDCERLCPNAVVLNYTNPMNMMCLAAERATKMKVVGLCHSVQGSSQWLAKFAEVPYTQVKWDCAGINHLAWYTRFEGPEGDLYPKLIALANDRTSDFAKKEPVRSDMLRHFGAFITESSGHLSEYLPYYRKRKDLRDTYTIGGYGGEESFYANNWPTWRKGNDEARSRLLSGEEEITFNRTEEYGAWIIESIEKNVPITIYGNVPNRGCIENLLQDGCVEVACLINQNGVQPVRYGRLPSQMAAMCDWNMRMFDTAVEAILERSKEKAAQALMLDPLTAAMCSPAEIREMTMKMFDAEREFLPGYR
ncbi:MAG TPA: alpha-glucosidase/alpha-galactosidase [Fimbriimonadaceae bacterium]|nr:alpha-glucosidase/alpha-galactosidase [Fimbriimonadaceae bacterium]